MSDTPSISQDIRRRLQEAGKHLLVTEAQSRAFLWIAIVITALTVVLVAEWDVRFGSSVRTAIVATLSLLAATSLGWMVLRPLLRMIGVFPSPPPGEIASLVGAHFPSVRDRLLNLLQLHEEASRGTRYSPELIDASFHDLAGTIQSLDFLESIDRSPIRHALRICAGSCVLPVIFLVLAPAGMMSALNRLLHFHTEFVPPSFVTFTVRPGSVEILKGESVPVTIAVSSSEKSIPSNLRLRWRPLDQVRLEEQLLRPDSSGSYNATLPSLRASIEYFAEASGQESQRFVLTIVDRPVIRAFNVRLEYPAYTRLPAKLLDDFVGDVLAPAGTQITLSGMASKELANGSVVFDGDWSAPLDVRGMEFSYHFRLMKESAYSIQLKDAEQHTNPDPITYHLKVIPDDPPTVAVLQPGRNIDVAGISTIPLLVQIKDDFGFSQLRIGYRLIQSRYERPAEQYTLSLIPLGNASAPEANISWSWDISSLHLVPEDVLEYFVEVFDNDAVSGPKSARSSLYLLRLPSLEEVFSDLDKGHEESIDDLKKTSEQAKELKQKLESVNEDFKKNKDIDWQQQKKMEETAKRYRELQKKLDDVKKNVDSMVEEMQKQSVLSPETMEKYLELQQLFQQMDSEELQKALKQMQQAMQNMSREQLQQALQQVSFSEERFRESIERTLNLLKRIQIEQKLDELKKRAGDLAAQEEELSRETAQSDSLRAEDLAKRQDELKKSLDKMKESSEDVQNRMEEFFTEMPERELEQANRQLAEKEVGQKMAVAARQIRSGSPQQARQMQQQIQRDLRQFAQDVDALQQQMMQRQQQQVLNALRRATNDLLELSKREETLRDQSQSAPPNSSQLRKNAQDQMALLQDLQNVVSALNELSQRSFAVTPEMGKAIGEALGRMQAAMKALDVRSGMMAAQEQGNAMGALNKGAMHVQNALQALMQQSGGQGAGSLMGQLQMMAGQQLSINMKTQSMQDAARLAVEQEALRKSLEQLNKEAAASAEHERVLGDLQHIADEMKDVVKNLQQNNVNPETVQKQERILSRLLDAARSTRERDFEQRRKATTGTQVARRSPGELDPAMLEGKNRLNEDLLKAMEQGYSKDYQELIRKYFEQLQKTEDNQQPQR